MAKRKRARAQIGPAVDHPAKRTKRENPPPLPEVLEGKTARALRHPVLTLYYPRVITLRDFLLSTLPPNSRVRRRRITTFGLDGAQNHGPHFFDSTLIGILQQPKSSLEETRQRDFVAFTQSQQRLSRSSHGSSQTCLSSDLVDFAIWVLFHRSPPSAKRSHHLLCHGFQKKTPHLPADQSPPQSLGIPGVVCQYPNENVRTLKQAPWTEIMPILGRNGDVAIRTLFLDCGIFVPLPRGKDNLYQLSGIPLSDLTSLDSSSLNQTHPLNCVSAPKAKHEDREDGKDLHLPGSISFVRSRMLYARPALNASGQVRFGLKHIHVLNRFPDSAKIEHTVHIMKYVFPRQFGLHNVFTSVVDAKETVQSFKDYTLREQEMARAEAVKKRNTAVPCSVGQWASSVPKRLRGAALGLIQKMQKRHRLCSYTQLLRHYCPSENVGPPQLSFKSPNAAQGSSCSGKLMTQVGASRSTIASSAGRSVIESSKNQRAPMIAYSTPAANVSVFCQAIVRRLLPRDTFGHGPDGAKNESLLMKSIDCLINMRRFETLSLHQVVQGLSITCVPWLSPAHLSSRAKMSQSDFQKRRQIFLELIYYIFDSLLIPLVSANFYVTESNCHRNQLFYFRHDVWRKISEPCLNELKLRMFEEVPKGVAAKLLRSRTLGFSQIRLLPKASGARPILNLRRRVTKTYNGRTTLGVSINTQLAPVFNSLNYERTQQASKLGGAMFSVGELHSRLKEFKNGLTSSAMPTPLYFVKVDIQSCFDTIPQGQVVRMIDGLMIAEGYRVSKHAEIKAVEERGAVSNGKAVRKFVATAHPLGKSAAMSEKTAGDLARTKRRTVFTDTGNQRVWDKRQLMKLVREHVQRNMIKIGKRCYRQKNGIPQGSVLSTLLCSFFYGAFEQDCLGFLQPGESLLLRLIDDFLLITTNVSQAKQFVQVMADGNPAYGISVNSKKTLANFEVAVKGRKTQRQHGHMYFPYCGMMINTRTLEVGKDRERKDGRLCHTLTVERSRRPGQTFHRRVMASFKIQMHAMLLDSCLNTRAVVMSTLYQNFMETGMKMYRYIRCLPEHKRPDGSFLIETVEDVVRLAVKLTQGRRQTPRVENGCWVTRGQAQWLGAAAMAQVLQRKQTRYGAVLGWAREVMERNQWCMKVEGKALARLVDDSSKAFQNYEF